MEQEGSVYAREQQVQEGYGESYYEEEDSRAKIVQEQ